MIITFTGHAFVSSYAAVKEKVKQQLRAYVDGARAITFYLGGYGSFDEICAAVCRELKQEYDGIELVYVTPYISLSEQDKIRRMTEQKNHKHLRRFLKQRLGDCFLTKTFASCIIKTK